MKKMFSTQYGVEVFSFGEDNKLKVFKPNSFKFKPKEHIVVDESQQCILDNFWNQYINKREDRGYFLSILNSLAEYFHHINKLVPSKEVYESIERRPLYVIYDGSKPGIYLTFEEVIKQQLEAKEHGGTAIWKKYGDNEEAVTKATELLGNNLYIEPIAREYIQNFNKVKNKRIVIAPLQDIKEEQGTSKKPSYKECLIKGVDPFDGSYIDWKVQQTFDEIAPQWKESIKEDIMNNIRKEIDEKFEDLKKIIDEKLDMSFMDDDMDIAGHGQDSK